MIVLLVSSREREKYGKRGLTVSRCPGRAKGGGDFNEGRKSEMRNKDEEELALFCSICLTGRRRGTRGRRKGKSDAPRSKRVECRLVRSRMRVSGE